MFERFKVAKAEALVTALAKKHIQNPNAINYMCANSFKSEYAKKVFFEGFPAEEYRRIFTTGGDEHYLDKYIEKYLTK